MSLTFIKNQIINAYLKRTLLRKIAGVLFIRFLGTLASYLFSLYVSKRYGANVWGMFSLVNTCILFSVFFGKLGLDTTVLKFTSESKINNQLSIREVYLKGIYIILPVAILISILFGCFSDTISVWIFHKPELSVYLRIASLIIIPAILTTINAEGLRGSGRAAESAILQNLGPYGIGILLLILNDTTFYTQSILAPLVTYLIACFVGFLVSVIWWFPYLKRKPDNDGFSISTLKIFNVSMAMFWIGAMTIVIGCIDLIILGIYSSDAEIGIYSIAVKISCVISVPLLAVNSVVIPKYIEHHSNGDSLALQQIVRSASKIMFYICSPILIIFLLFSGEIMSFFGQEFIIGKKVLVILTIGQFVNILFGSSDFILQVTGFEKVFRNIIVCAGILNICLNFLLIPQYGINGAGFANLITLIVLNLTSVVFIKKKLNVHMSYLGFNNLFLKSQKVS